MCSYTEIDPIHKCSSRALHCHPPSRSYDFPRACGVGNTRTRQTSVYESPLLEGNRFPNPGRGNNTIWHPRASCFYISREQPARRRIAFWTRGIRSCIYPLRVRRFWVQIPTAFGRYNGWKIRPLTTFTLPAGRKSSIRHVQLGFAKGSNPDCLKSSNCASANTGVSGRMVNGIRLDGQIYTLAHVNA